MRKIDMNDSRLIVALAHASNLTLGQVRNAILMAGPEEKSVREYLQTVVLEKARAKRTNPPEREVHRPA